MKKCEKKMIGAGPKLRQNIQVFFLPDNGWIVQKSSSSGFNRSSSSISKAALIGGNGIEDPKHSRLINWLIKRIIVIIRYLSKLIKLWPGFFLYITELPLVLADHVDILDPGLFLDCPLDPGLLDLFPDFGLVLFLEILLLVFFNMDKLSIWVLNSAILFMVIAFSFSLCLILGLSSTVISSGSSNLFNEWPRKNLNRYYS